MTYVPPPPAAPAPPSPAPILATSLELSLPPSRPELPARKFAVRALWARETDLIDEAFPRPTPPLVKDPDKGSLAPKIPDESSPAHQRALRVWVRDVMRAQVFLSIEFKDKATISPEELRKGVEELPDRFREDEIQLFWGAMQELSPKNLIRQAVRVIVIAAEDLKRAEEAGLAGIAGNGDDGVVLPEAFAVTNDTILYRAAQRSGQDPFVWPRTLSPEQAAIAVAQELIAQKQEDDRAAVLKAAVGMLGG